MRGGAVTIRFAKKPTAISHQPAISALIRRRKQRVLECLHNKAGLVFASEQTSLGVAGSLCRLSWDNQESTQ